MATLWRCVVCAKNLKMLVIGFMACYFLQWLCLWSNFFFIQHYCFWRLTNCAECCGVMTPVRSKNRLAITRLYVVLWLTASVILHRRFMLCPLPVSFCDLTCPWSMIILYTKCNSMTLWSLLSTCYPVVSGGLTKSGFVRSCVYQWIRALILSNIVVQSLQRISARPL